MQIEGKTFTVTNQPLPAGTWVEIDPTAGFDGVLIKARSTTAVLKIKRTDPDTDYLTMPAGSSLDLKVAMDADNHFYLQSDVETVAELMWVS